MDLTVCVWEKCIRVCAVPACVFVLNELVTLHVCRAFVLETIIKWIKINRQRGLSILPGMCSCCRFRFDLPLHNYHRFYCFAANVLFDRKWMKFVRMYLLWFFKLCNLHRLPAVCRIIEMQWNIGHTERGFNVCTHLCDSCVSEQGRVPHGLYLHFRSPSGYVGLENFE